MMVTWLIVLMMWSIAVGAIEVPLIAWLLLIPFFVHDAYDGKLKRSGTAERRGPTFEPSNN